MRRLPRHVIIGVLGGVGLFLWLMVATAFFGSLGCYRYAAMPDLGPATIRVLYQTGKLPWVCKLIYH